MILCAGRNETFSFARPIGVGLIESAMNLTELIIKENPTFLFFVGTAGSYGKYNPLDIVYSSHASNIELGFLNSSCYTPLNSRIVAHAPYVSRGTNLLQIVVNSSNYITTDAFSSRKMIENGIDIENMEFFSILSVANHFNIPCSGMFVVSNYCNKHAHEDFLKNHAEAKALICLHVKNIGEFKTL